jgi:phosphoenolpyruvate carboxykinase (ATP)
MFLRPTDEEIRNFSPDWHILCIPSFKADPEIDGTRQHNFAILNFTTKIILIGGTGYTGEIKKGIFSALNFILPHDKNVLSMHCSANIGEQGDTAIFFGLSGTGKTTLSSDPNRRLIGDDEHGWSDNTVFNFEGGCYAKTIDLSKDKEPQIYDAIKFGALLENIGFENESSHPDYTDSTITENTRVSYPIDHIENIVVPSIGGTPKNIFFLTADAYGVLPPISKLTTSQAMYHFMSGYTAKVAGTEVGITEPTTTFSAGFGAAFLPLHPAKYAKLLGDKLNDTGINVWLINTGWTGGAYGVGNRMKLSYTRAMITAVLTGKLKDVVYESLPVFELSFPTVCEGVPTELLNPRNTWSDKSAYDLTAANLANKFVKNFEKFASETTEDILAAAPKVLV